jgi:hypothetical protein
MKDSWRKFNRAWEIFRKLEREITTFLATEPVCIRVVETTPGEVAVKLDKHFAVPEHLPLVIGELIHNARSSLDAATFEVVQKRNMREMSFNELVKIQFQIETSWERFSQKTEWHANYLSQEELIALSKQQPFEYVKWIDQESKTEAMMRAPLARLKEISNLDKHRNIKLLNLEPSMFMILTDPNTSLGASKFTRPPWLSGETIFSFQYSNSTMQTPPVNPEFTVCFPEDAIPMNVRPVTLVLIEILNAVELTLIEFDLIT